MTESVIEFRKLTDAEQYFQFFQLPYDQQLVNVNRLHILKKFSQLMAEIDTNFPADSDEEKLERYKDALIDSYNLFITSSGVEQKLFKVFKEKPKNVDSLVLQADVALDCAHNFDERDLLNAACVRWGKPMVEAAMNGMEAYLTTIIPGKTPCLSCIFPEKPEIGRASWRE